MPQGKRRTAEEILGIAPRPRRSAEEILGIARPQPANPPAPQPEQSAFGAFTSGIAQDVTNYAVAPALSLVEAVGSAATGDFGPLKGMAEAAGRGLLKTASAFDPVNAEQTYAAVSAEQDPRIAELQAQREQRQGRTTPGRFVQQAQRRFEAEAARDTSLTNKVARGAGRFVGAAAPAVVTGIATGGSAPAIAATTALQSAAQPETAALNVGLSIVPIPVAQVAKAASGAVRRALGKGAAQIVEAEAVPAVTRQVQQAAREISPVAGEVAPAPASAGVAPAAQPSANILQSAFQKLGTDDIEQVGNIIANANRRYGVKRTPEQIQSSLDDFERLNQLTLDEQRALSQVLPERTVSPVIPGYKGAAGGYARDISDIPMSEVDAQLDANLRSLEEFFGGQGAPQQAGMRGPAATAPMDVDLPALEYEAGPRVFEVKAAPDLPYTETVGPRVGEPYAPLDVALTSAAETVPRSIRERAKDELLGAIGALKSIKSTGDISAPFRQGALLMLRPLQWRQAGKAWANQFRAFKTKNFEEINQAIAAHPDAQAMKDSGLYLANRTTEGLAQGEEAFLRRSGSKISEAVGKTPGIKHFEQAYTTFLDTQRVETFGQYKRLIDKAGLSPEEAQKAYKAAAEWINIATGRGSLGQRFDKSFEAMNFFLFSPRYVASRLNVFNPAMYIRNASSPGGRVVLKQQMSDLMQFAGTVASTMYLAKAAGADVGLNPNSPDFLKIRFGDWRYDMGAGLQQVMRLIYRVGADVARATRGEKPKPGQTAIDVAETFLSYKLSPPLSVFRNFINQRTPDKKPFTAGGAVADLVAPMQWADFVEAYQKEAWGGVLKALPGAVGIGVQSYQQAPQDAAIEKAQPLYSELQRLNKKVSELRRRDNEAEDVYNRRVRMFSDNYTQYGLRLMDSPRFKAAPDSIKDLALGELNERAKKLTLQEFAFPALALDANELMDKAEGRKERRR
jgi:hypothetical protein